MAKIKIFIIPRSRTGGTLLATMLNAHPKISMGYEIFPSLLFSADNQSYTPRELVGRLDAAQNANFELWVKNLERDSFRVFALRARRSGIEPPDILNELTKLIDTQRTLGSLDDKLDFIDSILQKQAIKASKPIVGAKMRVDPEILYDRHPDAIFLMMLRDGRDVLDSRLNVGNFNTSPAATAQEWQNDLASFEKFLTKRNAKGCLVPYEELVCTPEKILAPIVEQAGIRFTEQMINFHQEKQLLFTNAHGHLSAKQLIRGLNTSSIGRWREGLSTDQVSTFTGIAGDTLSRYGYL